MRKPDWERGNIKLYLGDCKWELSELDGIGPVITDPPYDDQPPKRFYDRANGNVVVWCKPEVQPFVADEYHFWCKTPSTKNFTHKVGRFVEMGLVLRRGVFNCLHWSQMVNIHNDRLVYASQHPYEKPVALMERMVRIYTSEQDVVVDPFMGSCSTGLACLSTGRGFVGIEIDPKWFAVAVSRMEQGFKESVCFV